MESQGSASPRNGGTVDPGDHLPRTAVRNYPITQPPQPLLLKSNNFPVPTVVLLSPWCRPLSLYPETPGPPRRHPGFPRPTDPMVTGTRRILGNERRKPNPRPSTRKVVTSNLGRLVTESDTRKGGGGETDRGKELIYTRGLGVVQESSTVSSRYFISRRN